MGNMIRGISENGGVIFCGVDSTSMVRTMEQIHKTSAVTSAALGRLLTAASIMGIMLKNSKDSITLRVNGGGPAGTVRRGGHGQGAGGREKNHGKGQEAGRHAGGVRDEVHRPAGTGGYAPRPGGNGTPDPYGLPPGGGLAKWDLIKRTPPR